MSFNPEKTKEDFPILARKICGHSFVYLDSAASAQKPMAVINSMSDFMKMSYANIHRGIYTVAEEATEQYENGRETIANFFNAATQEIIFTRGTTESINLVRFAWGHKNINEGDEILITQMEHHSNLVPWQLLAKEKGAKLCYIPIDEQGYLDLDSLNTLISKKTKIVALTYVSNTLGTINPVETIIQKAHAKNIPVLLDAAQAAPHLSIDVKKLDVDFLALSAHKMLGPTGIGVLYAKKEILESMDPFLGGGEMIKFVDWQESSWNELPWKFEAGTQSIFEAVGFAKAINYLQEIGMDAIHEHEQSLTAYAMERLSEIEGLTMYGPPAKDRGGLVAFNLKGIHPHDVAAMLDRNGIAVRAGHHCTQPLHHKLGLEATVRASFYVYNTLKDVDTLTTSLKEVRKFFSK